MGSIVHMGRGQGDMQLVICCSPRNQTERLSLGTQREKRRTVDSLPGFLEGHKILFFYFKITACKWGIAGREYRSMTEAMVSMHEALCSISCTKEQRMKRETWEGTVIFNNLSMLLNNHTVRMILNNTFISQRIITSILEKLGQYTHV